MAEQELSTESTKLLQTIIGEVTTSSPISTGKSVKAAPEPLEEGTAQPAPDVPTAPAEEQVPVANPNVEPEPTGQAAPEPENEEAVEEVPPFDTALKGDEEPGATVLATAPGRSLFAAWQMSTDSFVRRLAMRVNCVR